MQDKRTGEMWELVNNSYAAQVKACPDSSRHGIVLKVGDVVSVEREGGAYDATRKGRFRVKSIGRKSVVLDGLPGTDTHMEGGE